jgi:hypothetical protein
MLSLQVTCRLEWCDASMQRLKAHCITSCMQPRRRYIRASLLSPPTTLMTATCTRCRHPRTPSCPTNMHHSITQTLPRAGSLVAAVRISPPLCDGQVPGTRCAPSQQADAPKCARLVLVTCILLGTLVSRYSNEALLTALCFSTAPGLDAAGAPAAFAS